MKFKLSSIINGLKRIFDKGRLALAISVISAGSILAANALLKLLPVPLSIIGQVVLGIGLIGLGGFWARRLRK